MNRVWVDEAEDWQAAVERIRAAAEVVETRIWPPPLGQGATELDTKYLYATKPATVLALLGERDDLIARIKALRAALAWARQVIEGDDDSGYEASLVAALRGDNTAEEGHS